MGEFILFELPRFYILFAPIGLAVPCGIREMYGFKLSLDPIEKTPAGGGTGPQGQAAFS